MQFSIFKNKYKKENSNEPDYTISQKTSDGKFAKIGAGWVKDTKTGEKYISCTLNEPQAPQPLKPWEKEAIQQAKEKPTQIDDDGNSASNKVVTKTINRSAGGPGGGKIDNEPF